MRYYAIKRPGYFRRYKYYESIRKQQNDIRNFIYTRRLKVSVGETSGRRKQK